MIFAAIFLSLGRKAHGSLTIVSIYLFNLYAAHTTEGLWVAYNAIRGRVC